MRMETGFHKEEFEKEKKKYKQIEFNNLSGVAEGI